MDVLNDDLKIEILSHFKYRNIDKIRYFSKQFCKLSNSDELWNKLIERDFPFYPDNLPDAKNSYYHWNDYFDKYTLEIISKFITMRTKVNDLQKVYEGIFASLVTLVVDNNDEMKIEDVNEQYNFHCASRLRIINEIFNILSITIVLKSAEELFPIIPKLSDPFDIGNAKTLANIFYKMLMVYDDPL